MKRNTQVLIGAALVLAGGVVLWQTLSSSTDEGAGGGTLRLATTTSARDSGLLDALLPVFTEQTGWEVEVFDVGSGKALDMLRAGEADVALTHAPDAENAMLAAGDAAARTPVMRNDFVLVGPPAGLDIVAGSATISEALGRIAASGTPFVTRGDDSGTHRRERALWSAAGVPADADFLMAANAGMGATLARASEEGAFTLTDRATYLVSRNDLDLVVVYQDDDALKNTYSVVETTRADVPAGARKLVTFLRSEEGRTLIGRFAVEEFGEPLFVPEE